MPEVAPVGTEKQTSPSTSSIETTTAISRIGPSMKKDKTSALQEQDRDQELVNGENTDQKEIGTDHDQEHNGSDNNTDATESIAGGANTNGDQIKQDVDMGDASPASASTEQDSPMIESVLIRESNGTGTGTSATEGISQEDLDGGLLDGALDDYDDLDQDTEDTEVGNGEDDFSDDDDDDDDVDDKADHGEMHSPDGMSLDDVAKSDDRDMDTADESADHQDKGATAIHSEDSDSDLPEPEGSDNEHEDDEDDEEEEDEEDGDEDDGEDEDLDDEDEDEEPVKKAVEPKKESVLSQKPVLNRPSAPEEELKDSGDDLSDLSEFDDTDDSDEEDDDVPEAKPSSKESNTNSSSTAPASTTPVNGKLLPGGRKRSLHDTGKDAAKQTQESVKTEQDDQAEVPNGRARLMERKAPEVEDERHSDKESSSEVPEEEEEEKAAEEEEEEEEEEEDMETKQLHKDALEALTSIEVEFANLRDKMYEERMTELDREVEMINAGTHPELSSLMQEIEQKREQRLRFADMGKKYLIDIAQSTFQVAEYRAHCTYQSERRSTRSELIRDLGKKQRQMMMELTLSSDTNKRKVIEDKSTLIRARKLKRMEANELKIIVNEQRCFPGSTKLSTITNTELNSDFAAMGLARLLPQVSPGEQAAIPPRTTGHMPPSMPIPPSAMSSRPAPNNSSNRWGSGMGYPPPSNMPQSGGYYGSRPEVEIYVEGDKCMIDGIWYKPNDYVVVLDAAIGKYNAKYLYLSHDEIMLQRTDGSKTRLHLGLFRGRKLCMQPKP
ncbi:hypothetical protein BGX26_012400 [Mortierella sp. AD094]|nr:hypothetical protein BGX26_012400 [Mortierella sp. AD094]